MIGLFAAIHLAYAAWVLADPVSAASVSGIVLDGAAARGEFRALFGGLVAALGAVLACAPFSRSGPVALTTLAFLYGGLAFGRVVALVAERPVRYTLILLVAEGAFALCLLAMARGLRASGGSPGANGEEIRK